MQKLVVGIRPYLLLSLLCLTVLLPGLSSLPVMDRDEARFIQATRQMLETGDYVVVRFQDDLRAKKPVGLYWLQAASVSLFGPEARTSPLPYRIPSAMAIWITTLLVFRLSAAFFNRQTALLAAAFLATSGLVVAEGHLGKTDATLLLTVTLTQGTLGLIYLQHRGLLKAPRWAALAFWLAMGGGILVKGPLTPVIAILTILTLWIADRRISWITALRPLLGIPVMAAMVVPWFIAVSQQTEGAFLGRAITEDLLPKILGAQESHGGFPGFYLALLVITFWPASLFTIPAVIRAWRERTSPSVRFLLAWAGPTWILFELMPTKLPHYSLPLYPALAMMTAALLFAAHEKGYQYPAVWLGRVWFGLWTLVSVALAGITLILPFRFGSGPGWTSGLIVFLLLGFSGLVWHFLLRRRFLHAAVCSMAGAVLLYCALLVGLVPSVPALWVSERLSHILNASAPEVPVAMAGYSEPSAVFLLGTETRLVDGAGAADFLNQDTTGISVVERRVLPEFKARSATLGLQLCEIGSVDGFNYSRGKPVSLRLFQAKGC